MTKRAVLVVEYEVDDDPGGVMRPVIDQMREDGYLDGAQLGQGVRLLGLHGAIEGDAAWVMAVFERDGEGG